MRPVIPVTVIGLAGSRSYFGLVDTGSDNTILPKSIGDVLGIPLRVSPGPPASVFGGGRVPLLLGEAELQLEQGNEVLRWRAMLHFHEFLNADDETVILGHASFLDYFTATFDAQQGELTLTANDDLPVC
jgi:hypothetical protein